MKRSELEAKYLNNSTLEIRSKYKKEKIFCSKLYKKGTKGFYSSLKLSDITGDKLQKALSFWKTIKSLIKVELSHSKKKFLICFNKRPLKMMKNAFYFTLIVLFILKILDKIFSRFKTPQPG